MASRDESEELLTCYKQFHKLIRCRTEEAARCWAGEFNQEERERIVWLAATKIHLDVLQWTLLRTDDSTGRPWIMASELKDGRDGCGLLHDIGSNVNVNVYQMLTAFEFLIRRVGCRVNDQDKDGRTAFHCVCGSHVKYNRRGKRHYVRLLKLLVEFGADVNAQFHGFSPLHLLHESPWAMRYLLMETEAQANVKDMFQRTPLLWSLRNPHLPPVNRIPVSILFSKMKPEDFLAEDFMGHSLIHYAVLRAQSDKLGETKQLIRKLIEAGADVNHQNRRLRTALFFLVPRPDLIELAEYLVTEFKADVNLCDADGFTVVHLAAILGKLDYVTLFLPHMKSNVRTVNGETVRSCLQQYCDPSVVTEEVQVLLTALEGRRGRHQSTAARVYAEPYTVWNYVHFLDRFRDLFSLYIVDTFHRYRGGRSMFSDLFHHISHSAIIKQRANDFLTEVSNWKGTPKALLDIIDKHSVVIKPERRDEESSQIFFHVCQMVKELMKQVSDKDAREPEETRHGWELDVLPVGSAVDGSKILLPDEYDFLVVFRRFKAGDRLFIVGEDYIAQVERFRMHLIRCMQEMDSQQFLLVNDNPPVLGFQFVDCELRRICLNIRLTWWGRGPAKSPLHGLAISVDLTPVFHFQGWDNQSGFRPLRSLSSLPDWFRHKDQTVEHFRPVHNIVTVPPCAATMEVGCLTHPSHRLFQYCLRLLKLVVQCDYIVQDAPMPNSHFLKVALLNYMQQVGPPTRLSEVTRCVVGVCRKFQGEWAKNIPYFVSDAEMPSPPVAIREKLLSILDFSSVLLTLSHDCNIL